MEFARSNQILAAFHKFGHTPTSFHLVKGVNFSDVFLQGTTLKQIPKSASNNAYTTIPGRLSQKLNPEKAARLVRFVTTIFAEDIPTAESEHELPDALRLVLALQCLVASNKALPDTLLIVYGHGGDGKSLFFNHLCQSVFGSGHANMTSRNLQVDREFQQQGEKVIEKRWLNFDECDPDSPMQNELVKNLSAGGWVPLRKNHQGDTIYGRWMKTGKSWLMNNDDVPELTSAQEKSWKRRLRAIEMKNNFDSDQIGDELSGLTFLSDTDLKEFLESEEAGIAYWRIYLIPFMRQHSTRQCLRILKSPPASIVATTNWLTAKMARATTTSGPAEYQMSPPSVPTVIPESVFNNFLQRGELRITEGKIKSMKLRGANTLGEKVSSLTQLCKDRSDVIMCLKEEPPVFMLRIPGLQPITQPDATADHICLEKFREEDIKRAEKRFSKIEKRATEAGKERKVALTKNFFQRAKQVIKNGTSKRRVTYRYSAKLGQPYKGGRRYSVEPSLQSILRSVRSVLCKSSNKRDKDISNAHPTILLGMLKHITQKTQYAKLNRFPHLQRLVDNRDHYLRKIMQSYKTKGSGESCSREQAKKLILARSNGQRVAHWCRGSNLTGLLHQDLIDLFAELDLGRDIVVQSRPEVFQLAKDSGRERPELTAFSYILCE